MFLTSAIFKMCEFQLQISPSQVKKQFFEQHIALLYIVESMYI